MSTPSRAPALRPRRSPRRAAARGVPPERRQRPRRGAGRGRGADGRSVAGHGLRDLVGPNHGARGANVDYPYVLHGLTWAVVILGWRLSPQRPAAAELLIHAASIASILVPLGAFVQLWSRT